MTALEGKDILNEMIEAGNNRITIVVAGKVTRDNITEVFSAIKGTEFHGSKIV